MSERRWCAGVRARFEQWQIARIRTVYRRGTAVEAARGPAFEAMVDEMRRALDTASPRARQRADEDVLHAVFFAPWGPAILHAAARWWPKRTASVLTYASPTALRFLVGDLHVSSPRVNRVPRCAFRAKGGTRLCEQVCRRPSEAYTAKQGFPVLLEPDVDGPGCTWTWGTSS
ncbi:MAG: hypothetical protein ACRBN8_33220 [Nannocystales bacterium]